MSATNNFEANILKLIFQNVNYADIGDTTGLRGATAAANFFVSLHTAALGDTSTGTTSESAYGTYARVAVVRSAAGWDVTGTTPTNASNLGAVTFPLVNTGSETITDFGINNNTSGAGILCFFGNLTANRAISAGITPEFLAGALVINCD